MSQSFSDQDPDMEQPEETSRRPRAPEIKQPGTARRLSYSLFSRETRTGRFLRLLGRWLLTIVVLAGAGALAVYWFLYRPLEGRYQESQASLATARQELAAAQADRTQALEQRQQADARAEEAQARLNTELTRIRLLRGMSALKNAQLAATEKNSSGAKNAVDTAESTLKQIAPRLNQLDPTYASSIEARFTLVRNALSRDAAALSKEIEALVSELARMENELK